MAVVRGLVSTVETGRGVPGLVVAAIDVDSAGQARLPGVRLGSVVTDRDGRFALEYDRSPDTPPDIALEVTAPEGPGSTAPLYTSPSPREKAGAIEEFSVRLPAAALAAAGLALPAELFGPVGTLDSLARDEVSLRRLGKGERSIARRRVAVERTEAALFRSFRTELVQHLSPAPADLAVPDRRIVDPQDTIPKNRRAIQEGIADRFAPGGARQLRIGTRYHLDAEQKQALDTLLAGGQTSLSASQLRTVLTAGSTAPAQEPPAFLVEAPATLRQRLGQTATEQASRELLEIGTRSAPVGPPPGSNGSRALDGQVAAHLTDLLDGIVAPEDPLPSDGRGGQDDVQASVDGFIMRPGPADVPALFDFHRLQIAFEHVWQDVVDSDVLDAAEELHRRLRRLGGRPRVTPGVDPVAALADEAVAVARAEPVELTAAVQRKARGSILDQFKEPLPTPDQSAGLAPAKPQDLLTRLRAMIQQSYPFTVYGAAGGARSVNFGVVATYRQTWTPVTYQVGRLLSTLPLTPGESRKLTYHTVRRTRRLDRTLQRWDRAERDESTTTTRAETEIVAKALAKTSYELATKGTYNLWIAQGDSTSTLSGDSATDSADTKRSFREAVVRSANEYKQDHTIEFSTEESTETEDSTTQEIRNDNNELHVTYLFYELQRRYRLSERIHRVTPVVLVAQEVPNPSAITDAWVLANDWVIRRALLDEALLPALDYVANRVEGDRLALDELAESVTAQRTIVKELRLNLATLQTQATRRYEALLQAIEERAREIEGEDTDGFLSDTLDFFGGGGQSPDAARIREEAARDAQQRAAEEVKELQLRMQREVTALNEMSERYARLRSEHRNREVQIARLRLHVKQNILHYMQAIWSYEVPHQRFLRLHQTRVPRFVDIGTSYAPTSETFPGTITGVDTSGATVVEAPGIGFEVTPNLTLDSTDDVLVEVADLDQLLGFHGNYMIFPLKRPNPLTEVMTAPYVDAGWRLMDPDEPQGMTLDEFAEYVLALHEQLSEQEFATLRPELRRRYEELLTSPVRQGEEIVVPSDSIYVDALPGTRPVLEDFKLLHRGLDVRMARAKVRQAEMENLRYAARLLSSELEDPEIDKRIVVDGGQLVVSDHT